MNTLYNGSGVRPALILIVSLFLLSCSTTSEDKFGMVDLFHGRPVPPKMVPRHLLGPMPVGTLPSHQAVGVVILDTGCDYQDMTSMTYLQSLLGYFASGNQQKADLPCHFFIDEGGRVYSGRDIISPGEIHYGDPYTFRCKESTKQEIAISRLARKQNKIYDLKGYILICMLGDYDSSMVVAEQEKSLFQLLAYLTYQHNIPLQKIYGLKQIFPETENPGFYLNNYLQSSILVENIPPPPSKHRFLVPEPRLQPWEG